MNRFDYINGILHAETVSVETMAANIGTPFYCYSTALLERHYALFADAFSDLPTMICYAVKANSNQAILATLNAFGCGADVVSHGELKRALAAGIPANRIVFSGVGKTGFDLDSGLSANIYCFNVESVSELKHLSQRASSLGKIANISLRVNPDVDAKTHDKISTGKARDKFGIAWDEAIAVYALAATLPGIKISGIDMHIGSQIIELEPFECAFAKLADLTQTLINRGHTIAHVDIGGGLGIAYRRDNIPPPEPKSYAAIVKKHMGLLDCKIILEPGRLIVGNAGILVGRVIYVKPSADKVFIIGDTGMNDLIRPTLYDAWHEIYPVSEKIFTKPTQFGDLVGPVCESGDFIARERNLPALEPGDLYAIGSVGAYGAVQSNTYNSRALVPEVLVRDDHYHIIRPRSDLDELIAMDSLPSWLKV